MIITVNNISRQITKSTQHPDNTQKTVGRFWHFS